MNRIEKETEGWGLEPHSFSFPKFLAPSSDTQRLIEEIEKSVPSDKIKRSFRSGSFENKSTLKFHGAGFDLDMVTLGEEEEVEKNILELEKIFLEYKKIEESRIKLNQIAQEARDRILNIEGDEEDGWPGYEKETLDYAISFLNELDVELAERVSIFAASSGTIDLHWKEDKFEMLINFTPEGNMGYYGDDYNGNLIQGNSNNPKLISCWMNNIA